MAKPRTMRVQLKDLPHNVIEEIRRQTGDYVVPIVIDHTPSGSGTLVQIDEWLGILTAEHVARHPTKAEMRLGWTGHPERFLRTALGPFAHDLSISTNALRIIMTTRTSDAYGPDLAFILLPLGPFLSEVRARKSFYNSTVKTDQRRNDALADLGLFALCGFPAVKDFTGPAELGFHYTQGLYGYSMLTGPERYEKRDEWDYYEIGVSQRSADEFKRTFGGVSGGAVWRAFVERAEKDAAGGEYLDRLTLAGVAFYEFDDRSVSRFYVRAHGPLSIYDNLISLVRQQLALVG